MGIVNSIKSYCKKSNTKIYGKLQTPIMPYFIENLANRRKGCREFYDILQESTKDITYKYRGKWERDLNYTIANSEWSTIHTLPFVSNLN